MRASRRFFLHFVVVSCVVLAGPASAELWLPHVIGDHMVLQQDMKAPIWGKAEPGQEVVVAFNGRAYTAEAAPCGRWEVELRPCASGGPFTMTITAGEETRNLSDILVGEVWVASGQSNMQWTVSNSNNAEAEIADADYPDIRLFYVPRVTAAEPQEDVDAEWVRCTPETVPGFSAVAYYFGRTLYKELKQPIGLIHTSWGGTPAESWTSLPTLETDPMTQPICERWVDVLKNYPQAKADYERRVAAWEEKVKEAKAADKKPPRKPGAPQGPDHPWRPASLYNAMIAPLIPYGIRGAIWYQGESNAGRAFQYRTLFPMMITDWRNHWDQGNFPFYFVQLANWRAREDQPGDSDWAELREAQLMTLDLPHTGMAVTIDIGEADDIHPRNKQDVGKRLALNALAKDYGKDVVYSGPIYEAMQKKDNKIIVKFDHAGDGLQPMGGDTLKGFAIAGEDQAFVWAKAEVVGKNKIAVWADEIEDPVAVRYAWAINPECNLYNGAGLPASPFRTDDWPCITRDAR